MQKSSIMGTNPMQISEIKSSHCDGNAIKLGCDDHCTTINVKFIELFFLKNSKKKKNAWHTTGIQRNIC